VFCFPIENCQALESAATQEKWLCKRD